MGWAVFHRAERDWDQPSGGDTSRGILRLSDAMTNMRANLWRLPPGARGRRHKEGVQEEVFVALEGTPSLALGEPPERIELPQGSVCVVQPGTPLQVLNDGDVEAVVFIIGAPAEAGRGEYLPDAAL